MKTPVPVFLLILATLPLALPAQQASRALLTFDSAYFAWQEGKYPDALARLDRVLTGPDAARFREPAALLTGEAFRSVEVAPSNRYVINVTAAGAPRWSPDGRHFVFETTSANQRLVHIYRYANGAVQPIGEANGHGAAFAHDGSRIAFFRIAEDDMLRAARADLSRVPRDQMQRQQQLIAQMESSKSTVIERDLSTGAETVNAARGVTRGALIYGAAYQLYLAGSATGSAEVQLYRISGTEPIPITAGGAARRPIGLLAGNRLLLGMGNDAFSVTEPGDLQTRAYSGTSVSTTANGAAVVFLTREGNENLINVLPAHEARPILTKRSNGAIANPAVSPDGRRVVFQAMPREDWELYVSDANGENERRLTREIQHDHTPRFLTNDRVLGVMGENRHRRSYLYDLASGARTRLFHNNQIRTVSMEYAWAPSPDGSAVLIVADRDGDTISPERGLYLMDLNTPVTTADLITRIDRMAMAELDLRARGQAMYAPIAARVRAVTQQASVSRVFAHEKTLYEFDSKYITQPGNQKAAEYIFQTLKAFGYEPEYQYFEPRPGVRTANVLATLRGSRDPELIYVVSSHYDSVERGPGADDDTSGSAALLEAARIMAGSPMPATIKFAWFTGEEAGLLGSREFVRLAVAAKLKIIGALNNDMVGFANDERLDNTIRYSNVGLRDLQHAAAFLFSDLITYDSKYYQSTDAHAYFEAYGDIVGGIGSYPILGNPHYHQTHDQLETINHQLVTEVARTTAASLMLMASSPARLKDLKATRSGNGVELTWSAAPESGALTYLIAYGMGPGLPGKRARSTAARALLSDAKTGDAVWVKAVNVQGLQGWDWARVIVP